MTRSSASAHLRQQLAQEAARLMYHEGVKHYLDAKRIAARRLLGKHHAKTLRYRPQDLPSNGELREALLALAERAEGGRERALRLFAMRALALNTMHHLDGFDPRLIGSVQTGHVRRGSDIDLHVFTDDLDALIARLDALGWAPTVSTVSVMHHGQLRAFTHAHIDRGFDVELSVYPTQERRKTSRSSTDGKPIVRTKPAALDALLQRDHPAPYAAWSHPPHLPIPHLDALLDRDDAAPATLADLDLLPPPPPIPSTLDRAAPDDDGADPYDDLPDAPWAT